MSTMSNVREMRVQRGFTLIELMIVVALIGIMVAIGYPSYQDYILKGNRAVAKGKLLDVVSRQEQFFGDNKSYADDLTDLGFATATMAADQNSNWIAAASTEAIYVVSVSVTGFTFILTATTANRQADDTKCGNLTITDAGVRGASGTLGAECWE